MTALSSISTSGLAAAQATLETCAHNVANSATPGFKRQQAAQTEQADGSVHTTLTAATEPGDDLAAEMVSMLRAKNAYLAHLAVFKADDLMGGTLLDATG